MSGHGTPVPPIARGGEDYAPLWTASAIAAATGGSVRGDFTVDAVTFDSREVIGGELFVAMKGEATDGHRFIESAHARCAAGFLVSADCPYPHVRVDDTMRALVALGEAARTRAPAIRFGITGSVGKTGVKEALRHALAEVEPEHTHWSVKSYNNHTGVPLSLARMPRATKYGVFEMGMNHAGEMAALTRLVRPHIALVNWVTSAHIGFFASEDAIADAKAEIFEGLEPGGTAILPIANPHYERLRAKAAEHAGRIITVGAGGDVAAVQTAPDAAGTTVVADVAGERCAWRIAMPGEHWVHNSLMVMAAAHAAGADLAAAGLGLSQLRGLAGRGEQHRIAVTGGEALLIDESYNANPASMAAALALLGAAPASGRRIAVLGAMRELGRESDRLHAELAPHLRAARVDRAILVGAEMAPLAAALDRDVDVVDVADAKGAEAALAGTVGAGDVVLIKGSNSVGLGRLVEVLRWKTA
jgi:UDP-N-acetylmuramoyl-tripeptide--D-alanyl-D-alanine ligase